jgi:hypothetical protein
MIVDYILLIAIALLYFDDFFLDLKYTKQCSNETSTQKITVG